MRAAMYIRVSTEEQVKEGYSIDSQKAECMRWISEKGYDVVETYLDDGYSSKTLKRPSMQRMLRDIERRKFDVLVFWRLNRLTRTVKDKETLFDLFERYDVSLKSMTEQIDTTTASGRMITNLLVSVAQGEREQTAENVHGTMMNNHLAGLRQGAAAPYGYDLVDGKLVVNEQQADVVKRIFAMYGSNELGFRGIAVKLNSEPGIDRVFSYNTVRYILMNPVYIGKLRWNYRKTGGRVTGKEVISEGPHNAIVDEALFIRINREIRDRKRGGKVATSEYAFAGILRCARCGSAMSGFTALKGKDNEPKRYYRCVKRAQTNQCNMPSLQAERVETAFLSSLDYDPSKLRKDFDLNMQKTVSERRKQVDKLKRELEVIQKRKKKWQIAFANDAITIDELKQHTNDDRAREEHIKKELQEVPQDTESTWSKDELLQQLTMIKELWKRPNITEKARKAFIRRVFEYIAVDSPQVTVHGYRGLVVEVYVQSFKVRV